MPRFTPAERSLRGQIAINERWARATQAERDATARRGQAGLLAKFEAQVDPDGTLPTAERARRAEHLRKAHMARLALASSRARAARRAP